MRRLTRQQGQRLAIGAVGLLLVLAVVWVILVPAADWLGRHDVGAATPALRQTARDAARGRLLTLGAGLLAAGALIFTARNFALSREGQVTDRYTKAITQLGDEKLDVRIGGIYALERVARDSARDHPTVMEVLTAFIREHSRGPELLPKTDGAVPAPPLEADVQAALTVIGRRDAQRDVQRIDLKGAGLTRANLGAANLRIADLFRADLSGADLFRADLTGADLTGAHLTGAHLLLACLRGANLSAADLTGADLSGAYLAGADLTGAYWPTGRSAPPGWVLSDSGRLARGPQ